MKFQGYLREDGRVGTRNHVLVMPSVGCANNVVRKISAGVPGTTWIEHQHGCSQLSRDASQTKRVLVGHGVHPNVYGVVVVSLGCETVQGKDIVEDIKKLSKEKRVEFVSIQEDGGSLKAIEKGKKLAEKLVEEASKIKRQALNVSELVLGTECGGSDSFSGLSANSVLGEVSDRLIDEGGSVILAETTELIGTEDILAARAVSKEVAKKCYETIRGYEQMVLDMGEDIRGGNPSPGNIEGGLSSIEEKSLGCLHKAGSKPLEDVVEYAHFITKKGLTLMNTPGNDVEQLSGMVAGGSQICIFTTGRGTPTGSAIVPTVKISTNSDVFRRLPDVLDLDAGKIIEDPNSMHEVKEELWKEFLEVASGKLTKAELMGQNDFAIWRIGPTV